MWAHFRRYCLILFIWVFTAFSGGMTWWFGKSLYDTYRARSWNAVDCRIIESGIRYSRGNSRIAVTYAYTIAGVEYRSSRYEFLGGYSTPSKSVPPELGQGKIAKCYVDPDDPSQAVIQRDPTFTYLFGFIPLFFVLLLGLVSVGTLFEITEDIRNIFRRSAPIPMDLATPPPPP